jgi:hypothetical protein
MMPRLCRRSTDCPRTGHAFGIELCVHGLPNPEAPGRVEEENPGLQVPQVVRGFDRKGWRRTDLFQALNLSISARRWPAAGPE